MKIRNKTGSPYSIALADGSEVVIPAMDALECEPSPQFLANMNPNFFVAEEDGINPISVNRQIVEAITPEGIDVAKAAFEAMAAKLTEERKAFDEERAAFEENKMAFEGEVRVFNAGKLADEKKAASDAQSAEAAQAPPEKASEAPAPVPAPVKAPAAKKAAPVVKEGEKAPWEK